MFTKALPIYKLSALGVNVLKIWVKGARENTFGKKEQRRERENIGQMVQRRVR